jgi:hypothetical protein
MDTPHEIVAALVANALDDIEAGRLDVSTALRIVAEAAWHHGPLMRQLLDPPSSWSAAV